MVERSFEKIPLKSPNPRSIGIALILLVILILLWGSFVIIQAGHRGVVLW